MTFEKEKSMSAPIAVRAATLTFAVGVVGFLVFHASATAGCGGTTAGPHAPGTAAAPNLSVTVPAPSPDDGDPNANDNPNSPRYFPATKAGPIFTPPPQQPAGKAHAPNAAPQQAGAPTP
jgi:hypothetical protein